MGYSRKKIQAGVGVGGGGGRLRIYFSSLPHHFLEFLDFSLYTLKFQRKQAFTIEIMQSFAKPLRISNVKNQDPWKFHMNFLWTPLKIPLRFNWPQKFPHALSSILLLWRFHVLKSPVFQSFIYLPSHEIRIFTSIILNNLSFVFAKLCITPPVPSHNASENVYLEWSITYFGQKKPIKVQIFSICTPWLDWAKFNNFHCQFQMSFLKPRVSFLSSFASLFIFITLNCSLTF